MGIRAGPDVWRTFADLAEQGLAVVEQEAAPVTLTEGVRFLLVGGVVLVAWAVDSLAVTLRRATLAGIPLLALYLVPATVLPDGVPWPLFLAAGDRMAGPAARRRPPAADALGTTGAWQHQPTAVRRWHRPAAGRCGTGIALVVPVVLPSLDDGRFGGNPTGEGSGREAASRDRAPSG